MKTLKAIMLPVLVCLFVFIICLSSYADDGQDLINAARTGNIVTVKALLAKGADVNAKTKYGMTA